MLAILSYKTKFAHKNTQQNINTPLAPIVCIMILSSHSPASSFPPLPPPTPISSKPPYNFSDGPESFTQLALEVHGSSS